MVSENGHRPKKNAYQFFGPFENSVLMWRAYILSLLLTPAASNGSGNWKIPQVNSRRQEKIRQENTNLTVIWSISWHIISPAPARIRHLLRTQPRSHYLLALQQPQQHLWHFPRFWVQPAHNNIHSFVFWNLGRHFQLREIFPNVPTRAPSLTGVGTMHVYLL